MCTYVLDKLDAGNRGCNYVQGGLWTKTEYLIVANVFNIIEWYCRFCECLQIKIQTFKYMN